MAGQYERALRAVLAGIPKGVDAVISSGDLSEHLLDIIEIAILTENDKWNKISELISDASIKKGFKK